MDRCYYPLKDPMFTKQSFLDFDSAHQLIENPWFLLATWLSSESNSASAAELDWIVAV